MTISIRVIIRLHNEGGGAVNPAQYRNFDRAVWKSHIRFNTGDPNRSLNSELLGDSCSESIEPPQADAPSLALAFNSVAAAKSQDSGAFAKLEPEAG